MRILMVAALTGRRSGGETVDFQIRLQGGGYEDRAVALLPGFDERHKQARKGRSAAVEDVRESRLARGTLEAQVHSARLVILAIGDAGYLEVAPLPWRPDFNIVRACAGETQVTGAKENHAVMQSEFLEHPLRMREHLVLRRVTLLRARHLNQFYFVELVHTNKAPCADARGAGLAAEARGVGTVPNWQLVLAQNFFTVNVGDGGFRGRNEIKRTQFAGVIAFSHTVILIAKFWELADSFEALRPHYKRRRYLGVAMLANVQIEEKLNQGALEACAPPGVQHETAARKLCGALKVHQAKLLAQVYMRLRREIEFRLLTMDAHYRVVR